MKTGKGNPCSPEMAQKIVNLLFRESSGDALLEFNQAMQTEKGQSLFNGAKRRGLFSKSGPLSDKGSRGQDRLGSASAGGSRECYARGSRRKSRKVTPELIIFVHSDEIRTLHMNETLAAIKEKFGIVISMSAVYKIWNMNMADVNKIRAEREQEKVISRLVESKKSKPGESESLRNRPGRITARKIKKEERIKSKNIDKTRAEARSTNSEENKEKGVN